MIEPTFLVFSAKEREVKPDIQQTALNLQEKLSKNCTIQLIEDTCDEKAQG